MSISDFGLGTAPGLLDLGAKVVQSAQGSSQLGKTVKMGKFMSLAAILTHYLKTLCKYEIFS